MDDVKLTRAQLRTLAKEDRDVTITATNQDQGMIFIEPTRHRGEGKGKWMLGNGRYS